MSRRMTNDEAWKNVKTCIPSLICGFVILTLTTASASVITVETKTIGIGDHCLVNITCIPSQPMKSWEFSVITTLPIENISLGGFFQGFNVFSVLTNPCYALTLGKGNMTSEPGVLLRLRLRAEAPGVYPVVLTGAGVTDDKEYIPLIVENGTISVMGLTEMRSQRTIQRGWTSFQPYTWRTITSLRVAMMLLRSHWMG